MKSLWRKRKEVAKLIRLDKQYGTLLLLLPTLWSLWIASEGRPTLKHLIVFTLGAFLMRSAGCVMNDMADRAFDARVERTRDRPLARQTLTLNEARGVLLILLGLSFPLALTLNRLSIFLSFGALLVAFLYPFAKRVTHLPQVILGLAFSWGVLMAWSAVRNEITFAPFLLVAANLFWGAGYDTVYALMDREDDLRIGVKSTAVLFGPQSWLAVSLFYMLVLFFLTLVGERMERGIFYSLGLLGAAGLFLFQIIQLRRTPDKTVLFSLFRSHVWIGLIVFIGIVLDYYLES
ncbi:MAG TPA: 4-hydroxybenzoate octaprenyltransferase [Candidatus Manganitrophaceae bacterium]|nr:4-hydroxybenzoate octaprenyltransferase [Candidatus Manganitrophaceae bacterium]